jgi:hypothetical protein
MSIISTTSQATPGARPGQGCSAAENTEAVAALHEWRALVAALVAVDPGPQVRIATAQLWAARARAEGYEAGWNRGRLDLIADEKRAQVGIVRALREAAPPASRWHLCCRPCRLGGHRPGCPRCQDRTLENFGQPHGDDFTGLDGAA